MKKLLLALGLLLIALNTFAAGDLIVDGKVGVGTASPNAKEEIVIGTATDKGLIIKGAASQSANWLESQDSSGNIINQLGASSVVFNEQGSDIDFRVEGDTNANNFFVDASTGRVGIGSGSPVANFNVQVIDQSISISRFAGTMTRNAGISGMEVLPTHSPTASGNYNSAAVSGVLGFTTANWGANANIYGLNYAINPKGDTVAGSTGLNLALINVLMQGWGDVGDPDPINNGGFSINNLYGIKLQPYKESGVPASGSTDLAGSLYGIYIIDSNDLDSLINAVGIWIEKQTQAVATANYGIVLDGDGSGADILFGESGGARPRLYSNAGRLYAQDSAGNVTLTSPHDPETREWIFYSKNINTGKVVRVNMEELVRDMEKLTGKTYMVETVE